MESEHTKDEQHEPAAAFSMEVSRERVESLWRQALNHQSSGRADLAAAKASRTKAEMERQKISHAALEAAREACRELIAETEWQLARAKRAEADAEKALAEAQNEMKQAEMARSEADNYREKVMAEAQQETQRVREEARASALQECEELKRHVTYEVQCILSEIDTIRAAAQEELEAQRIYAEAATIQAMSQDVRAQIMGNVDKTMREWSGGDRETSSLETSDPWRAVGVGEEHHPGAMMEPEQAKLDSFVKTPRQAGARQG